MKAEAGTKDSFHARGWTISRREYMIRFGDHCWFFSPHNLVVYRHYPMSMFKDSEKS